MQNLHASVCTMSLPQQLACLFSVAPSLCVFVCPGVSPAVCPASPGYPFFRRRRRRLAVLSSLLCAAA